jgi:hypothetical protein
MHLSFQIFQNNENTLSRQADASTDMDATVTGDSRDQSTQTTLAEGKKHQAWAKNVAYPECHGLVFHSARRQPAGGVDDGYGNKNDDVTRRKQKSV